MSDGGRVSCRPSHTVGRISSGISDPGASPGELDCLRDVLPPDLLRAAMRRADALGVGADRVLIEWGVIEEADYLARFSRHTGLPLEDFAAIRREDCPISDEQLPHAAAAGLIPVRIDGRLHFVVAPRHNAARSLGAFVDRFPAEAGRIRLTSAERLHQFLTHATDGALARAAAAGLLAWRPDLSAALAASLRTRNRVWPLLVLAALAILLAIAPRTAIEVCGGLLAFSFLAFAGLRFAGSLVPHRPGPPLPALSDDQLPVYSVIVALYREARCVAPLLRALGALDYPREKLDIKLAVEPDDLATRAAIARYGLPPNVEVIVAPPGGPKTKPKALNAALPFARGSFVCVFDAEDLPEPGQLRAALDTFRREDRSLACAQARLAIHNGGDSWLARMFAAEYAGQFDIFLPGLARLHLPLPLGGSSNHFRTAVLREVGGWDAYNVTEDADLGIRLARFGYRTTMFDSTTREEAPWTFRAWLRQRSRWMKGWLQTWLVHMRSPLRLWREAGPAGLLGLNLIVGANVLTALAHPFFFVAMLWPLFLSVIADEPAVLFGGLLGPLHLAAIAAGYGAAITMGLAGLARRNQLGDAWVLAMMPLYWLYLSAAAWRALFQLLTDPYRWEKTEHGVSPTMYPDRMPVAAITPAPPSWLVRRQDQDLRNIA